MLFRRKRDSEDGQLYQYLLDVFEVKLRKLIGSVEFDASHGFDDLPLQCATDDFVITQLEDNGVSFLKAFAR